MLRILAYGIKKLRMEKNKKKTDGMFKLMLSMLFFFKFTTYYLITLGDSRKNIAKKIIPKVPTNKKV